MLKKNKSQFLDDFSIVSEGMKISGSIVTHGNLRVDGQIMGDVVAVGNITIGEKGLIEGNLKAKTMTIGGKVLGAAEVQEKLILEKDAILTGDIISKILVIEEGANFSGRCEMKLPDIISSAESAEDAGVRI